MTRRQDRTAPPPSSPFLPPDWHITLIQSIARLEATQLGNRQAMLEQVASVKELMSFSIAGLRERIDLRLAEGDKRMGAIEKDVRMQGGRLGKLERATAAHGAGTGAAAGAGAAGPRLDLGEIKLKEIPGLISGAASLVKLLPWQGIGLTLAGVATAASLNLPGWAWAWLPGR